MWLGALIMLRFLSILCFWESGVGWREVRQDRSQAVLT